MNIGKLLLPDVKVISAMNLYPGKTVQEVREILKTGLMRRMRIAGIAALTILLLCTAKTFLRDDDKALRTIRRSLVNGSAIKVPLVINNSFGEKEAELYVSPIELTDEDMDDLIIEVGEKLDLCVLNGNESFDEVTHDLLFPETLQEYPVLIEWSTGDVRLITLSGQVKNQELEADHTTVIAAKVWFGREFRLYERTVTVKPYKYSEEENAFRKELSALNELEKESRMDEYFIVPEKVGNGTVRVKTRERSVYLFIGLLCSVGIICITWDRYYDTIVQKKKKRVREAEREYREFVSKLSVLLSAGMSVRSAWKKMTEDYEKYDAKGLLYENLLVTCREMNSGITEKNAYERFGERMDSACYRRIASIMVQSLTKGVSEIFDVLLSEQNSAVEKERESIKIRGEQTGTKLLLPMMGFLIIVFALLLVPAFTNF